MADCLPNINSPLRPDIIVEGGIWPNPKFLLLPRTQLFMEAMYSQSVLSEPDSTVGPLCKLDRRLPKMFVILFYGKR